MRSGRTCPVVMVSTCSSVPANQVEQRKKENPHDVHEMPVEPDTLDVVVVVAVEPSAQARQNEPRQKPDADDHVQSVQPGHPEIEEEKELRMRLNVGAIGRRQRKIGPTLVDDPGGQI